MRTTAGPKGEPCLERAVAGNYSGVDASRCSCPISAGGIVWCRGGIWPWMLQAQRSASTTVQHLPLGFPGSYLHRREIKQRDVNPLKQFNEADGPGGAGSGAGGCPGRGG